MTKQETARPAPQQPATTQADPRQPADRDDPELQGEGNYTAARRHRESVERFVDAGKVDRAARDAEPATEEEARELREAEKAGRAHARK